MKHYPNFIEVNGKKYNINTDFRIALECDEISKREDIGDYEVMLAIIYKLFGEEALNDCKNGLIGEFFYLAVKYLKCGDTNSNIRTKEIEPSMDFEQDQGYIKASFMHDYHINLDKENIHWWQFYDLFLGLSDECVINRVRNIREEPLSGKKGKELEKLVKMKEQVALKHKKTEREKELDKIWEMQMRKE